MHQLNEKKTGTILFEKLQKKKYFRDLDVREGVILE